MPHSATPTLELRIANLSKTYANGVRALDDISLTLQQGMYGLLGPNGAGKSTLMRTLATLQQPDSGSVQLGDIDVLRSPEAVRQSLGYLPQEFGVYPGISAEKLLDHFAILKGVTARGERRELVEALLRRTNLWEVRRHKLGGYSVDMTDFAAAVLARLAPSSVISGMALGWDQAVAYASVGVPRERRAAHRPVGDVVLAAELPEPCAWGPG